MPQDDDPRREPEGVPPPPSAPPPPAPAPGGSPPPSERPRVDPVSGEVGAGPPPVDPQPQTPAHDYSSSAPPRGTHVAWARLERSAPSGSTATEPIDRRAVERAAQAPSDAPTTRIEPSAPPPPPRHPAPAPIAPPPVPAAERTVPSAQPSVPTPQPSVPAAPRPTVREPGVPSAIGRLIAVVVTCGLGWALAVAIGIWLLVFLIGRL